MKGNTMPEIVFNTHSKLEQLNKTARSFIHYINEQTSEITKAELDAFILVVDRIITTNEDLLREAKGKDETIQGILSLINK